MSIFRNKILVKIIASLCIFLAIINFGIPNRVYADWGGILITPITTLLTSIADGIIGLIHKAILQQDTSLIQVGAPPDWWEQWGETALHILIIVVVVIVAAVTIIYSGGTAAAGASAGVAATIKAFAIPAVKVATAIGTIEFVAIELTGKEATTFVADLLSEKLGAWFGDIIYAPAFLLTPETIFSNQIAAFDVNFFEPMEPEIEKEVAGTVMTYSMDVFLIGKDDYSDEAIAFRRDFSYEFENGKKIFSQFLVGTKEEDAEGVISTIFLMLKKAQETRSGYGGVNSVLTSSLNYGEWLENVISNTDFSEEKKQKIKEIMDSYLYKLAGEGISYEDFEFGVINAREISYMQNGNDADYEIMGEYNDSGDFTVKIGLGKDAYLAMNGDYTDDKGEMYIRISSTPTTIYGEVERKSSADVLQETISKWYFILRNLALLVLMLVLIYSGIRIVIGSTAGEKAKYKERLMDWLVAICLIFIMHYIMIFAIKITEKITELIVTSTDANRFCRVYTAK